MKRFTTFFLCFLFVGSACRFASPSPAAVQQEAATILPSAAPLPTLTKTPPLAPTSTLEAPTPEQMVVLPTLTSLPPPQTTAVTEIKFDAGGTWKDTSDVLGAGETKTYSLYAMQGQVMSVSIAGGYFPLQIQGRNGAVLCPAAADVECSFWRGALPLSQDYYITVQSGESGEKFTLRVAINPPGKSTQQFDFSGGRFSLSYSDEFAPASPLSTLNNKTQPELTLQFVDTSAYIGTNLREAYFVIGSSSDAALVATCLNPNPSGGAPEIISGGVELNGYTFTYSTAFGAGAGNIYEQHIYRAVQSGACYEAIYFIHSSNIDNYPPGVVTGFDSRSLMMKFESILASLKIK